MRIKKNLKGEKTKMALFGKKKRSIDELIEDIAELSEDEKSKLLAMLNGENQEVEEPVEVVSEEVEQEETVEEEPSEGDLENDPVAEQEEVVDEVEEVEEVMDNAPTETPEPIRDETPATNYDDVIAAQAARIDSLEASVAELKQTVETVVSNQDNKNFGVSPKADFNDDEQNLRRDAILQSYAPRRYDQYK